MWIFPCFLLLPVNGFQTLKYVGHAINICYWPAGRSVSGKTVTEVLKMLPEAAGLGQHFQARGHSFSLYGPTLRRPITFLSFFSCCKLAYKFFYKWVCLRHFAFESAYAPSTVQTIRKKFNEQTSE